MDFRAYLKTRIEQDASDLYLTSGAAIGAKINGTLTALETRPLSAEQIKSVAYSVMNAEQTPDNANQALDRIVNFFPEDLRNQLLQDLSRNLRAFVSQRLVKTVDGKRTAAVEILLGTPLVQDMIRRGDVHELKELMEKSANLGMQTFDSALFKFYQEGTLPTMDRMSECRGAQGSARTAVPVSLRRWAGSPSAAKHMDVRERLYIHPWMRVPLAHPCASGRT